MLTDSSNPYRPPDVQDHEKPVPAGSGRRSFLVPPILSIALTLVLWVSAAAFLSGTTNQIVGLFLWSSTLILSLVISTAFINLLWPHQTSAISIGLGYVLFGIVFCIFEGDTSGGADLVQAAIIYGTLIVAPVIASLLTVLQNRVRYVD